MLEVVLGVNGKEIHRVKIVQDRKTNRGGHIECPCTPTITLSECKDCYIYTWRYKKQKGHVLHRRENGAMYLARMVMDKILLNEGLT